MPTPAFAVALIAAFPHHEFPESEPYQIKVSPPSREKWDEPPHAPPGRMVQQPVVTNITSAGMRADSEEILAMFGWTTKYRVRG
ncbi:MAG: hypothetical protein ACXWCQ_30820 [Burkholderiales bacterium]